MVVVDIGNSGFAAEMMIQEISATLGAVSSLVENSQQVAVSFVYGFILADVICTAVEGAVNLTAGFLDFDLDVFVVDCAPCCFFAQNRRFLWSPVKPLT